MSQIQVTAREPKPAPCGLPGGSSQEHWQGRKDCKASFNSALLLGVKDLASFFSQHNLRGWKKVWYRHSVDLSLHSPV